MFTISALLQQMRLTQVVKPDNSFKKQYICFATPKRRKRKRAYLNEMHKRYLERVNDFKLSTKRREAKDRAVIKQIAASRDKRRNVNH